MKLLIISVIICLFGGSSLYTDSQIKHMAYKLAQYREPEDLIHLGDLLYVNIHEHIASNEQAGTDAPQYYKDGWRKKALNNPQLLLNTIKIFGPKFKKEFEVQLLRTVAGRGRYLHCNYNYYNEDSAVAQWRRSELSRYYHFVGYEDSLRVRARSAKQFCLQMCIEDSLAGLERIKHFRIDSFWVKQKALNRRYLDLTNALLNLPASTLNSYFSYLHDRERVAEVQEWLYQKNLIEKLPQCYYCEDWYVIYYPLDLLLLSSRVPNPREFLINIRLGLKEIDKLI